MSVTFNEWIEVDGCGAMPLNLLTYMEELTITVQNTFPPVTNDPFGVPVGGLFQVILNGQTFTPADGSFFVAGRVVNWTSPIYAVNPGDDVVAVYNYMG